jgi:hypothetical protein
MTTPSRGARFAAACGLLYPLLLVVGDDVIAAVAGEPPGRGATPQAVLAWATASDTTRFFAGRFVGGGLALLCLLVFVAYVSRQIRQWDDGWLAAAALGAGTLASGIQMLTLVPHFTAVRRADQLDPDVVSALAVDLSYTFGLAFLPLAMFIAIAGIAAVRGDLMARWIGWSALVVAGGLIVSEYVFATSVTEVGLAFLPVAFAWFIWFPAASISLLRRAGRRAALAAASRSVRG